MSIGQDLILSNVGRKTHDLLSINPTYQSTIDKSPGLLIAIIDGVMNKKNFQSKTVHSKRPDEHVTEDRRKADFRGCIFNCLWYYAKYTILYTLKSNAKEIFCILPNKD